MSESAHDSDPRRGILGRAIASLILGLFLFVLWLPVWSFAGRFPDHTRFIMQSFLAIASGAAAFAIIYSRRVKAAGAQGQVNSAARVMAAIGRVFGYLSLATVFLFFVGGYFARRFVEDSRRDAAQGGAVRSLKDINAAAKTYASTYGHGFPATLAALGPPRTNEAGTPPQPNEKAAGLLEDLFSQGERWNYHFIYIPGEVSSDGKISAYTVYADPLPRITTARNHYFSDQSGIIRSEEGKAADVRSKPME
jgi:hypothetical protein